MSTAEKDRRILRLRHEESGRIICELEVSAEVYRAYWQEHERAAYGARRAARWELSRESLEEGGMAVEAHLPRRELDTELSAALDAALEKLAPEMREALWALACGETTERALAARWGVSKSAVHKRKQRALASLRQELAEAGFADI